MQQHKLMLRNMLLYHNILLFMLGPEYGDVQVGPPVDRNGQPVNGAIPSLPSPTMPTFNMAAQTPNGPQVNGQEAVYTNGIPTQTFPPRKCNC